MDIIQILNIDLPIKAYNITSNINKFKTTLRKQAIKYLQNNGNYFANGVVYPDTLEIIEWQSGIKQGSILGDEMVFKTTIRACFRMYPIGSIQQGRIVGINNTHVTINNEYVYSINIPLVKSFTNIELINEQQQEEDNTDPNIRKIEQLLTNNNPTYPYLSANIQPSDLKIGQTVEFIVLDLSSKFNPYNIIVLGFLNRIIDTYSIIYSVNCDNKVLQIPEYNKSSVNEFNIITMLPKYYINQDIKYIITNDDINDNLLQLTKTDEPVDKYYMCYYYKNPSLDINITDNIKSNSVLLLEFDLDDTVTQPFSDIYYKSICKNFANVYIYYNWYNSTESNKYTMWVVCTYKY